MSGPRVDSSRNLLLLIEGHDNLSWLYVLADIIAVLVNTSAKARPTTGTRDGTGVVETSPKDDMKTLGIPGIPPLSVYTFTSLAVYQYFFLSSLSCRIVSYPILPYSVLLPSIFYILLKPTAFPYVGSTLVGSIRFYSVLLCSNMF